MATNRQNQFNKLGDVLGLFVFELRSIAILHYFSVKMQNTFCLFISPSVFDGSAPRSWFGGRVTGGTKVRLATPPRPYMLKLLREYQIKGSQER